MPELPAFFIPSIPPEEQESRYMELARWSSCQLARPQERIYSIRFVHDGCEWVATVGQTLRGEERRESRSRGRKVERKVQHADPAVVLAIFSGPPCFVVVTNSGLLVPRNSRWVNPFLAGTPKSVTYFAAPPA